MTFRSFHVTRPAVMGVWSWIRHSNCRLLDWVMESIFPIPSQLFSLFDWCSIRVWSIAKW